MNKDIKAFNDRLASDRKEICELLAAEIHKGLPGAENKIWHGSPVWFINGNPIVGYWVRKDNTALLFWSGQSFDEPGLQKEGSFKAAEARYTSPGQINSEEIQRWLQKSKNIQWDYKHIVKNKGVLERLK